MVLWRIPYKQEFKSGDYAASDSLAHVLGLALPGALVGGREGGGFGEEARPLGSRWHLLEKRWCVCKGAGGREGGAGRGKECVCGVVALVGARWGRDGWAAGVSACISVDTIFRLESSELISVIWSPGLLTITL